ncbi:FAD-binding oxidoreductase [Roseiarcaceae bacterium H3SJ34-1]|uniref:FAD-binding oxidoreductase n=1 Tax=Terripilifer ovatus TaxID=3032367 RepID=UPI003AB92CA2|nr:FAD-binding oxidoreductase [Roseiarcaceae bacterium H3SJ34-1]
MAYMLTPPPRPEMVNDIHSGLNPASMRVHRPTNRDDVCEIIRATARNGSRIALCGGRHAMGGQQFLDGGELLDLRGMNRILELDMDRGLVRAEGGIQWPELISGVLDLQRHREPDRQPRWGIAQKQTGADLLTLGGALAANVHGRGLLMGPIVSDVEAFTLIAASGDALTCSRTENAELFSLAIGGYGLFGVIADVTLRLTARRTLRRVVRVIDIDDAVKAAERRIREGFLYGDFQFDIDPRSPSFLTKGVFSGYCPLDGDPTPPSEQRALSGDDWLNLLTLAHTDKSRAFTLYAQHYLATDGQLYASDTHQLTEYLENYHVEIDRRTGAKCAGSEMITELYVPPERLVEFMQASARLLIERDTPVIYGTVRLIQPDTETVMRWASQRFACIIFNLHVDHEAASIERAADSLRSLIDLASDLGGSYYLTYHRFATPQQLERCYPRVREFFNAKRRFDPDKIFRSDWYNHYAPHSEGN